MWCALVMDLELVHFVGDGPSDGVGPGRILCKEVPECRGFHPTAVDHVAVDGDVQQIMLS